MAVDGAPRIAVRVQTEDFSAAEIESALVRSGPGVGATVAFTGWVRDANEDSSVTGLFLEHYPGMTERTLEQIAQQAAERWHLCAVEVVHRVGALRTGERIVCVGVAAAHRREAFAAGEFIMDYLKTRAPFWKKETRADGEYWLEARDSDRDAAKRWAP